MLALSFTFPHHGEYSSYHRLLSYLHQDDAVVDASLPRFMYGRVFNRRGKTARAWRSWKERQAWKLANARHEDWLHYIYPEHGYFQGDRLRKGETRIAMSCHLPQEFVEANSERLGGLRGGLSVADAMIVMSPDSVEYYQSFSRRARVAFIPHGVDIHYFYPRSAPNLETQPRFVLTVGNMLRDFEALARTINLAADRGKQWTFRVVARKERLHQLQKKLSTRGSQLLEPLYSISNNQLRETYQSSDVLYLPLIGATANNAVVEAMACGLPMLLSDFPATRAYAGDTCVYLSGSDPSEAVDSLSRLLDDTDFLEQSSEAVRRKAVQELAWEVVAQRQRRFLNSIEACSD